MNARTKLKALEKSLGVNSRKHITVYEDKIEPEKSLEKHFAKHPEDKELHDKGLADIYILKYFHPSQFVEGGRYYNPNDKTKIKIQN